MLTPSRNLDMTGPKNMLLKLMDLLEARAGKLSMLDPVFEFL